MSEHVRTSIEDGVMRVTLCRAEKKNALTNLMYKALAESLAEAEQNTAVRAVLFSSEGDSFTAGNDVSDFAAVASGTVKPHDLKAHSFIAALAKARKPLVAAVQGRAVGVGLTWLLHCDLVYVADDAKLSAPFVDLGLVPEAASSVLLPPRRALLSSMNTRPTEVPVTRACVPISANAVPSATTSPDET